MTFCFSLGAAIMTFFFWNFSLGFFLSLTNFFLVSVLTSVSSSEHDSIVMGSFSDLQEVIWFKIKIKIGENI